jgi:3-dehydroquinate dehydratase / shikimate dehydrogenase
MICVSVGRGRHRMMLAELQHLGELGVGLAELRLDFIRRPVNLQRLLEGRPCPVIATCRRPTEGGKWMRSEQDRLTLLRTAIADKADYVDLEHDIAGSIPRFGATKRIVSYHNFNETPENLDDIWLGMSRLDPDVIKIATFANSPLDNLRVLRLIKRAKLPTIAFCMGEMGIVSRDLCLGPRGTGSRARPAQSAIDAGRVPLRADRP